MLSDQDVREKTKLAFEACAQNEIQKAMKHVIELKGVGPATASAILSVYDSSVPFMADEALESLARAFLRLFFHQLILIFVDLIGKRQYTLAHFNRYREIMNEKANTLGWTAQKIQLALWAEHQRLDQTTTTAVTKKRKLK